MGVDSKGKEILEKADFDKFRKAFIDSIMRRISFEGKAGSDISTIIEQILREEGFDTLVRKLVENIAKETNMSIENSRKALPVLLEEDVANDIKKDLQGQVQETRNYKSIKKNGGIYKKGEETKLWKNVGVKRFIGQKPSIVNDVFSLIKEHNIIKYTISMGFCFLAISALLFHSLYKAVLVGLTLTAFPGESAITKTANIIGGVGGILIFFVFLTLVLQYLLLTKTRDEQVKELARNYLEKNLNKVRRGTK